jgi:hypothetical protein
MCPGGDIMLELEGTWEEILAYAPTLTGRRVRLMVVEVADAPPAQDAMSPAEQFAAANEEAEELEAAMPLTWGIDSVSLVRQARAGAMYGYEPCE